MQSKRELTPDEIAKLLQNAKARGLPDGWTVEVLSNRNRKIWISPDGSRRCDTIPKALAASVKMGLLPVTFRPKRVLTPKEASEALTVAKTKGLPDRCGWTVEWSNERGRIIYVNQSKRYESLIRALAASVKMGKLSAEEVSFKQALTPNEVAAAMEEAKARGLPDGWKPEYDSRQNRRMWIYKEENRRFDGIPSALAWSAKLGLISEDKVPDTKRKSRKSIRLTQEEIGAALEEAKARGLSDGWGIEWDDAKGRRVWVSPDKMRRLDSLPKAIAASIKMGLSASAYIPPPERVLTPGEVSAALEAAKAKGLPDGWKPVFDNKQWRKIWIAPDGRQCYTIPEALIMAGISARKPRRMSPEVTSAVAKTNTVSTKEIKSALRKAKKRGLPDGWSVEMDEKRGKKAWVSPDGEKKCKSIRRALAWSTKKCLIDKNDSKRKKKRPKKSKQKMKGVKRKQEQKSGSKDTQTIDSTTESKRQRTKSYAAESKKPVKIDYAPTDGVLI